MNRRVYLNAGHMHLCIILAGMGVASEESKPMPDAIKEYVIKQRKEDEKALRPVKCSILPAHKPYGKKYRRHNK